MLFLEKHKNLNQSQIPFFACRVLFFVLSLLFLGRFSYYFYILLWGKAHEANTFIQVAAKNNKMHIY